MRLDGIRARRKQGYRSSPRSRSSCLAAPNRLQELAQGINQKWLADIVQIEPVKDGTGCFRRCGRGFACITVIPQSSKEYRQVLEGNRIQASRVLPAECHDGEFLRYAENRRLALSIQEARQAVFVK